MVSVVKDQGWSHRRIDGQAGIGLHFQDGEGLAAGTTEHKPLGLNRPGPFLRWRLSHHYDPEQANHSKNTEQLPPPILSLQSLHASSQTAPLLVHEAPPVDHAGEVCGRSTVAMTEARAVHSLRRGLLLRLPRLTGYEHVPAVRTRTRSWRTWSNPSGVTAPATVSHGLPLESRIVADTSASGRR